MRVCWNKHRSLYLWSHHFDPTISVIVARQACRKEKNTLHGLAYRYLRFIAAIHPHRQKRLFVIGI